MTLKESLRLVAWATANFPQLQERDMRPTAELWAKMLEDVPYEIAEKALVKVLATAKYFPTVAELREAVAELRNGQQITALEAWGLVIEAVKKYGYYRQEEALASLPPEVSAFVRRFGWEDICCSEEPDVVRGQFRRAWEEQAIRKKELAVLPEPLRQLINNTTKKLPEAKPLQQELPPAPDQPEDKVSVAEIEALIRQAQTEDIAVRNNRLREALARMDRFLNERGA